MQRLDEISPVLLQKNILKVINIVSLFLYYLPLRRNVVLILTNMIPFQTIMLYVLKILFEICPLVLEKTLNVVIIFQLFTYKSGLLFDKLESLSLPLCFMPRWIEIDPVFFFFRKSLNALL